MESVIDCPICYDTDACFEDTQPDFKSYMCFNCGFMSHSHYTEENLDKVENTSKLVNELKESDIIIISAPIYNYGPPATLKAWSDLAARVGETFRFKPNGRREGLLKNKKAYFFVTFPAS